MFSCPGRVYLARGCAATPRLGDCIRALYGTEVVHESKSGLKWISYAGAGGTLSLSSQQDQSVAPWMDGWRLQRYASCSAAGADRLQARA